MSEQLMQASHEWATRPDDQRYLSLEELAAAVGQRKAESWTVRPKTADLRMTTNNGKLAVEVYDPTHGERRAVEPSHWGFGQLAQYAAAPAAYLRSLPAELAAINMQWGFENHALRDDALMLCRSNGKQELRAVTSTSYGRIWDSQVVQAVQRVNADGRWQIPAASYATTNPKRATTLYASDRDVFIFLVDPTHPIEVPGKSEPMFRGFFTWNSETGAQVFGLTTFLYDRVCDNRIIWGATEIKELRIRHTGGAPERFAYEGAKYLNQYSTESAAGIVEQITAAQRLELEAPKDDGGMTGWLQARGFTKATAEASVKAAEVENGQARSLWDIVSGITAHARTIKHTDVRVDLETKAGKLMAMVA